MQVTQARLNAYRADVDAYASAAATYVEEYMNAVFSQSAGLTVADARDEAIAAIGDALNAFGGQASGLALNFFEELADANGADANALIEDVVPNETVDSAVRYSARKIIEGDYSGFTKDVRDLTRYYVHRSAFENMERNCHRNDLRYARVPSGRETCGFCFMLCSRGFVYRSKESAGYTNSYHKNCDCIIVPGFQDATGELGIQIEGYDPDAMYDRWKQCADTVGANASSEAGCKSAISEAETRDWKWLYSGEKPAITFETVQLENEIRKARPQELRTAARLSGYGLNADFIVDERVFFDKALGCYQTAGLADLNNGTELKTLQKASSYNTIDDYLRNVRKKEGVNRVVFDNTENASMTDENLTKYIMRSRRYNGSIYMITHKGEYRRIK